MMMREDSLCRDCDVGILNFIFQILLLSIDNSLPDYKNSNQNNESSHSARKKRDHLMKEDATRRRVKLEIIIITQMMMIRNQKEI